MASKKHIEGELFHFGEVEDPVVVDRVVLIKLCEQFEEIMPAAKGKEELESALEQVTTNTELYRILRKQVTLLDLVTDVLEFKQQLILQ